MRPATGPRAPAEGRLLVADPIRRALRDARSAALAEHLRSGDLLVVNDAATLPASLAGAVGGEVLEARLTSGADLPEAWAVLFGAGDWRTRTEDRPPPPAVRAGDALSFPGLEATVTQVSAASPRLARLRFSLEGEALLAALYRVGRPIQYAHAAAPLQRWDVQTPYAARPWAVEAPSAGLPLRWEVLSGLRARGVELASLTHAAGLSSTGDAALDALLPLPERYEIPAATARAVLRARAAGRRVVAVGTSVVRALESAALDDRGASGIAALRIDEGFRPRVVDAVLTGMHEPGTSHYDLLRAFARDGFLEEIDAHAERAGYLAHEFGDHTLLAS